ncbi:MAG: hypothetical protein GF400_06370 [Candidatus Eisenbacteria bacterium]|nr:hypothetical protein [Candidatus Eisenbacteria bacterium]
MRKLTALALVLLVATLLPSCGEDGDGGTQPEDSQGPTVESTQPTDGSTDLSLVQSVSFTFSEPMDSATINDTTLLVSGRSPSFHVGYDAPSRTATITPDTLYATETWHSAVLTEGVTDEAGNPAAPETVDFRTGPMDCAHLADAMEPNEEIASAAAVAVGDDHYSLTVCDDDKDTYEFSLSEAAKVRFSTYINHAPTDAGGDGPGWQIHFMRADGEYYSTLGTVADPDHTPSYSYSFFPGTYYCEIYSSYGMETGDYVLYDLSVTSETACQDDPYEDNDFQDEATPITEGLHTGLAGCDVDEDWFSIEMSTGDTLTVTVDATFQPGDWENRRLMIRPPSGDQFYESGTTNPFTGQAVSASDGTAYLYVQFWEDDVTYTLDIDLSD